jgi:hypothetical protein
LGSQRGKNTAHRQGDEAYHPGHVLVHDNVDLPSPPGRDPELESIISALNAMGLRLAVHPLGKSSRP